MRARLAGSPAALAVASSVPASMWGAVTDKGERETKQYWRSRRSAKFFPVDGEDEDELRTSLQLFFKQKLCIPDGDVREEEVEQVRRLRMRRGRQNVGEVLVLFSDIETRDRVTSYARNLAQFIDIAGKPTAGIRFDIPDHLHGVHKTLLQYGHALWVKHNKDTNFKHNIRHDDAEMTFCLDMKFPRRQDWITVSYTRALADRKQRASTDMNVNDELLSSTKRLDQQATDAEGDGRLGNGQATPGGTVTSFSWRAPKKT